jgi:hypothetical protein
MRSVSWKTWWIWNLVRVGGERRNLREMYFQQHLRCVYVYSSSMMRDEFNSLYF